MPQPPRILAIKKRPPKVRFLGLTLNGQFKTSRLRYMEFKELL